MNWSHFAEVKRMATYLITDHPAQANGTDY